MVGLLKEPMKEEAFMGLLKERFKASVVRHSRLLGKPVKKVAVCGGGGSFLLGRARAVGADVFVTADMKYHQFSEAEGEIVVMDIGHFESEQFTRELFYDLLIKNFPKFAVRLSETDTNPNFIDDHNYSRTFELNIFSKWRKQKKVQKLQR